jgi:hypothetical protein
VESGVDLGGRRIIKKVGEPNPSVMMLMDKNGKVLAEAVKEHWTDLDIERLLIETGLDYNTVSIFGVDDNIVKIHIRGNVLGMENSHKLAIRERLLESSIKVEYLPETIQQNEEVMTDNNQREGVAWTNDERIELIKFRFQGLNFEEIGHKMSRTKHAVRSEYGRLRRGETDVIVSLSKLPELRRALPVRRGVSIDNY